MKSKEKKGKKMGVDTKGKIDWFWSHQRNMTLLQSEFVAKHFRGDGYFPDLPFSFDNQLFIYRPGHGVYLFYDRALMDKAMSDLQKQVLLADESIIKKFHQRTEEILGRLLMVGREIRNSNLSLFSNKELKRLFLAYKDAISAAPMITIQLWGIESCWLEQSPLKKDLLKHLKGIAREADFAQFQQRLSATTGKTVAYAEKEEFLLMLSHLAKDKSLAESIEKLPSHQLQRELADSPALDLIKKHMEKYAWITAEYKSKPWSTEQWLDLVKEKIGTAKEQLHKQQEKFHASLHEKELLRASLSLSAPALRVLDFLDACNIQRDWAKGKFSEGFLYFRTLADEIALRFGLDFEDLYSLSSDEIIHALDSGIIDRAIISKRREKGFMLQVVRGKEQIHEADEVSQIMTEEGVGDFFTRQHSEDFAKGLPACKGYAKGHARVIDKAEKITEFKDGEILITYMTTMEFTPLFPRAKAIVCDEGGVSSHAAIVSREFNIPCIVGTQKAMRIIKTGDLVEVDANTGVVRLLEKKSEN